MPELPEVEFARRTIAAALEGARITRVEVVDPLVVGGGARGLDALVGARGERIERRGKWLRFAMKRARREVLAFAHLGMSGRWAEVAAKAAPLRHERVRLVVGRRALAYVDPRRFGRIRVAREDVKAWRELGPDPLADGIDARALHAALHARRRTVKEALLDQRIVAGVGNIHATEALWRARIDPRSRTDALTLADVRALARGVRATIAFGLRTHERAARLTYVEDAGSPNPYRVYDRGGAPCPRCGHTLAKIILGARGTTFCPGCQRLIAR